MTLQLHYFSHLVALEFRDEDVYRLDQIKEFESVDPAWRDALAEYLDQGTCARTLWRLSCQPARAK